MRLGPVPSRAEIEAQGATCTVEFAGSVVRLGKTASYDAVKRGTFPFTVLKISARRWVVVTASVLRLVDDDLEREHDELQRAPPLENSEPRAVTPEAHQRRPTFRQREKIV